MKIKKFSNVFVQRISQEIEDGVLYICLNCNIVIHKCACGCGKEVATPIGSKGWKFIYDGDFVTLSPSIGNWGFPCHSHYWIKDGKVEWASRYSEYVQKKKASWNPFLNLLRKR